MPSTPLPGRSLAADFEARGYAVVPGAFSPAECREILRGIQAATPLSPRVWRKGAACSIPSFAAIARDDRIVGAVEALIGPDVVLWGASHALRRARVDHPWHSDAEACGSSGFVSAWLALRRTRPEASLVAVPGSHRYGPSVQEQAWRAGAAGPPAGDAGDAEVLAWARAFDPAATIERLVLRDGDLVLFDGRLWHGSRNPNRWLARHAVLLQYAAADRPVRMVRGSCDCFPFRLAEAPRPPCVLVRGRAEPEPNEIHPGLPAAQWKDLPVITNVIESIQLKADDLGPTGKQSFPVLRGASPDLASMSCHSSILAPGASPHPPHAHDDEEVLVVVSGRASLEVESAAVRGRFERVTAGRGDFAHYPRGFHHTIHNDGSEPLVYLMFKWRADETGERSPLGHARVRGLAAIEEAERSPEVRHPRILMEGPTACLRKLHAHWTRMPPGEGYAEHTHAHAYDAGLILLDGAVETLGQRVEAPALVYYASGQPHGLRNPDDVPARYLVFEFHGRHGEVWRPKRPPSRWQVWRRRLARRLRR